MIVVCFYWQGDRWQQKGFAEEEDHLNKQQSHLHQMGQISNDLPAKYINNLYRGVKRFADRDFKFICFTNELMDVDPDIELRSFQMVTSEGVLPRLHMFSQEAGLFGHQVLCLDIDILIVGSLSRLMDYEGLFCTRSKFKPGETYKLDGDIMSFKAGLVTERLFWTPFVKDIDAAVKLTQGRERYWMRHVANDFADRWDKIAPGDVLSYKWHACRKPNPPKGASIISCHGIPRPHQIKDKWVKEYWQ